MALLLNSTVRWLVVGLLCLLPACTYVDETLLPDGASANLLAGSGTAPDGGAAPDGGKPAAQDRAALASKSAAAAGPDGGGAGAGAEPAVVCKQSQLGKYGEIGIVRFGGPNEDFKTPLEAAVERLKALRPDLGFHLVLKIPEQLSDGRVGADAAAARDRVATVVHAMIDMGVAEDDIVFSGVAAADVSAYELHVFPVRICRARPAGSNGESS